MLVAATAPAGPVAVARSVVPPIAVPVAATTTSPFAATLAEPVAPGVDRRLGSWTTTDGPQVVELLDVAVGTPGISLEASLPAAGAGDLETVRSQAGRVSRDGHRVIAAVNGDVWSADAASSTLSAIGVQVHAGELLTGSTVVHPTLGLDATGKAAVGDVGVAASVTLPDGTTTLTIDRINKPRRAGELVLYTQRWGTTTATLADGAEVVLTGAALRITPTGSWTATVASVVPAGGNTAIPAGALVLSAQGADAAILAALPVGAAVTVKTTITAGWEAVTEAIGGREWLVHLGATTIRPISSLTTAAHPRTAVGIRADGHVVLAAVDGRAPGTSIGVTAADLADLLESQGAVEAIDLDGGGSTTVLSRRPGDVEASVVNAPSDGRERAVANALLVVSSIPTGALASIVVRPGATTAVVGQTVAFVARGQDAALNGVAVPPSAVAWSMTGAGGRLTSGGRFAATSPGAATVNAKTGALAASGTVTVVADTFAPVASVPLVRLRGGAIVAAGSIPVTVSWAAATDVGTGVARYELQRRLGAGPWTAVRLASATARSVVQPLAPGVAVTYQVRAVDRAGNRGAWKATSTFGIRLASEAASGTRYTGRWVTGRSWVFLGGAARRSAARGAVATYSFTGSQIAWIAPRAATRGSATVSLDGRAVTTISLRSSWTQPRRAVFTYAWPSVGRHTISIRVTGTRGHPWVDVDGFAVVDSASPYPILVGAGDIASCGLTADSATASLIDRIPGTVFAAGDLAYESGTTAEFANCYGPTWGRFASRTRPVPGNHDYVTAGAAPYYAYFGSKAGTAGQGWYAYDLGAWRIYALNSNCAFVGGCGAGSAQEAWLKADLAANPRACVAAYWHHPLFTSGYHGNDPQTLALWQDLYAAGADLVINGHDHDYERFALQRPDGTADPAAGIREFVVGTGGAALRPFASAQPNSQARNAATHGVLKLTLTPTGYSWQFVPVAGSTFTDSGSAACH